MTDIDRLVTRCRADGEFTLAARFWSGTLRFDLGFTAFELVLEDGRIVEARAPKGDLPAGPGHLAYNGPEDVWRRVLMPVPPPLHNDLAPALLSGVWQEGDVETGWQYYPAARRVVDLMRELMREEWSG